ncbi:hypothetical protein [Kribbia dieselivorans]|uniref:hypothetical protein n=1 Tax=Kribbia dieselivorans TaxID=331526 RepID=UPI000838C607|nr:hypothetical protein [Kribbia dieselivorans]
MGEHRGPLLGWAILTVILCVVVGYLTWLTAISARAERSGPTPVRDVVVPVERRTLVDDVRLACTVERPVVARVADVRVDGVVSRVNVGRGQVGNGEALIEIDGRPIVAIEGRVPMFRDIKVGDAGADVDQVRSMLAERGLVIAQPARTPWRVAEREIWKRHVAALGYDGGATIPRDEILVVESLPATVAWSDSALGSTNLDELTLRSDDERVSCPLAPGTPPIAATMKVRLDGQTTATAKIRAVWTGASNADGGGGSDAAAAGADEGGRGDGEANGSLLIDVTGAKLADGDAVVAIVERERAARPALVVPVSALWDGDGSETFVRVREDPDGGSGNATRDVPVRPGFSARGSVEVTPMKGAALSTGDLVVVGVTSGESATAPSPT